MAVYVRGTKFYVPIVAKKPKSMGRADGEQSDIPCLSRTSLRYCD
jgi:hypothetical protein